jgi:hypothetical protein
MQLQTLANSENLIGLFIKTLKTHRKNSKNLGKLIQTTTTEFKQNYQDHTANIAITINNHIEKINLATTAMRGRPKQATPQPT